MTSRKNKAEIPPLNKGKSKKYVRVFEGKDQCCIPATGYDVKTQNCTTKDKMTEKQLIVSCNSPRIIKKRKAQRISPRKTKVMRPTSGSKIVQESGIISKSPPLLHNEVPDSGLIISKTESCLSKRISPFSDNLEGTKNNTTSEFCNENILSPVSDQKLHQSLFSTKSPPSVPFTPLISKMSKSSMSISDESNLVVKENYKHRYNNSTFSQISIGKDLSGSAESEKVFPSVDIVNSSINSSNIFQNTFTDKQSTNKNSIDFNNMNSTYCDIITLLINGINEVKNSRENFICNQLKIKPLIKPDEFNYDHTSPFNIAVDISMLKAADDYIKESGLDDIPMVSSDGNLGNSYICQHSLTKPSDLPLDLVNFITDSNELNSEDVQSDICINNCNSANIQPNIFDLPYSENPKKANEDISDNLDNCPWKNFNNIDNFMQPQDLNVCSNETGKTQLQNLFCESVDLLNENNTEKSIKLCAKVKKKKKINWYRKKRKWLQKINNLPNANGLVNEISCDTSDEIDVGENSDLVPSDTCESSCLARKTKTKRGNTLFNGNSDNRNHDAINEIDQRTTRSMLKSKCRENEKNTEGNPETASQIEEEKEFSSDKSEENEQFSKDDQVKLCLSRKKIETDAYNKISSNKFGSLLDCDISNSNQDSRNPELFKESDHLDISEKNFKKGRNLSFDAGKSEIRSKFTSEIKDFKLLEGLTVGLEKLDQLTLSKYIVHSAESSVQEKSDKNDSLSTEHKSDQIVVDVCVSEVSCSKSEETVIDFGCLQNDVQLCPSDKVCQEETFNLKGKSISSKNSKHTSVHKSKGEGNSLSTDLGIGKHSKKNLKTTLKANNTSKKLHNVPFEKKKKRVHVLRSESSDSSEIEISNNVENHLKTTDANDTEVQFSFKELTVESEQKLSDESANIINKEKDVTDTSDLSKSSEKHSKAVDLSNMEITLSGDESNIVSDSQDISLLKRIRQEKSKSVSLVLNKYTKRHSKAIDSTNKTSSEEEPKRIPPKHKLQVTGLNLETEENGCSKDLDLDELSEKHLKNNFPKAKIVSSEKQSTILLKKPILKSKNDASITSNVVESNKHKKNHLKTTDLSKTTVTTLGKETDVSYEQNTHRSDDHSDSHEDNQNKKYETSSDSVKKSDVEVTKSSSKSLATKSKIKISRRQGNESSKSLPHLTTETGKKESKSSKAQSDNKNIEMEQNVLKKSVSKLNSKIASSKNSNIKPASQKCPKKMDLGNVLFSNTDCNMSSKSTYGNKVHSMKPIPKLSHKTKIEKVASLMNQSDDLKKDSSPEVKLTIDNSSNTQCPSSQMSEFENNVGVTSLPQLEDDASEAMILIDDEGLDFEPDQSFELRVTPPLYSSGNESLCSTTNEVKKNEIPASVPELTSNSLGTHESEVTNSACNVALGDSVIKEFDSTLQTPCTNEYPYHHILNRSFFKSQDQDLQSEEDTDSENEHSFKRTRYERKGKDDEEAARNSVILNNWEENCDEQNQIYQDEYEPKTPNEVCHASVSSVASSTKNESLKSSCEDQDMDCSKSDQKNCLKSKVSSGSVLHLNDVLAKIRDFCSKELFSKAVEIANTYFAISSNDVNKCILQRLLISIFPFILKSDKKENSFKILDDILDLICQHKMCNQQIASYFITKCCSHLDLNIYSMKLFHICQKENIPLGSKAVKALSHLMTSEEISLDVILYFMNYTKLICKKKISKELVHLAMKKCEILGFSDIHHTCSLLHGITPKEIEEDNLIKFILLCIQKNMWQHVAEMFIAWGTKNCLSFSIYFAFTSDYETMGKYFKKFANYVHEKEGSLRPELKDKLTPELKTRFGQMGTALMLNAFSKSYMDTALAILYTLHTYNVNYFELQLGMGSFLLNQSSSQTENYNIKIFPFSVVFIAIDICLQLSRPKDAFAIFQDFSWVMPDESLDEAVRTYAIEGRCQRLLKLILLLNEDDSLNEGWEALENLLTTIKQDLTLQFVQENVKDINSIYNKYLVSLLNAEKISSAYILYKYSLGPGKDIFTIFPDVLRGLVVAFSDDGRDVVSNSLFLLGVMRKIYPIQKPELENFPWEITLMTHWTSIEIKVALEWFTGVLFPLLMGKPIETNFEKWFSVKIVFNITCEYHGVIKCLKETFSDSRYYITKTKDALQDMNPGLEVTEIINENALCITSNSLYNFWKSRCPDAASKFNSIDMQFVKLRDRKFSFAYGGEYNCSVERTSSVYVKEYFGETCALKKSPDVVQQPQNSIKALQSLSSPDWHKPSATDVCEMIDEIKANTSTLSYIATTREESPPGNNLMHDLLTPGGFWFSESDTLPKSEQIGEFQHRQHLSNMITTSQNRLTGVGDKSISYTSKSQQITVSDINQSQNKSEILKITNHFPSSVTSHPKPLALPSPENGFQSVNSRTNDSLSNSNKSIKSSSVSCNSTPSGIKSYELLPKNSAEKQRKLPPLRTSLNTLYSPIVHNKDKNSFINSSKTVSMKAKKKLKRNSVLLFESGGRKATVLKTSVTVAQPIMSSKKTTQPVEDSLLKSRTSSVNKTPVRKQKLVTVKKGGEVKVDNDKNKFENFRVCVTPADRTVSSPFNQSFSVESEPNQSDVGMNKNSSIDVEEKPGSAFREIVSDIPRNQVLPVISKMIQNNVSPSLPCKVSHSSPNIVKSPVVNGQELNTSPQTMLKITKSPVQSVDSVSKSKFTKTVNLKNNSNAESKDISINIPFENCKKDQPKAKPVMKRNFSTAISLNMASKNNIVSHATVTSGLGSRVVSFERSEKITDVKQNFDVKKVAKEISDISTLTFGASNCSDEDFSQMTQFLEVKVRQKNKNLSPGDQNKRAHSLAHAFIRNNNGITKLDKRTKKLLAEFADLYV